MLSFLSLSRSVRSTCWLISTVLKDFQLFNVSGERRNNNNAEDRGEKTQNIKRLSEEIERNDMLSGSRELEENNLKESLKVRGQEGEEGVPKFFPHFCGLIRVMIRTKFRRPPVAAQQRTDVFLSQTHMNERGSGSGPLLMSWLCSCSHSPFACVHTFCPL